jgi:hypothetical protein
MWHISRALGFGALLAGLALLGSVDALAQKKKNKDKDAKDYPAATDADYKSIQKQKELPGKLVAINTGTVTIRVDYSHQEPNPKYKPPKDNNQINQILKTYADLQMQYQKAAYGNPKQVMQAQQRIANDMAKLQTQYSHLVGQVAKTSNDPNNQPFITITNTKDFDLEIMENCVYRKLNLAFEYDDTGNVKTYTKEEKDALRGDDKTKPGYAAKSDELAAGQEIKLYLTPPKKKEKDKDADKEKDKDAAKEPEEVQRPTVNMIVITKDNPTANITGDDGKAKKKKKDNN